ncbi:MAG: phenylacetic acid degradation protein PaaN [Cyclobacteriaceae bacterium]|nr:phenylacetic acid degradation protein PaaN [Cyclobacteriaceae bacterium]MDW8330462.1 phenylacetic acid degradation protein PaaN [Cyclobacteriaceae bacterium]
MSLFNKHEQTIRKAIEALHTRTFFAAFPEHPSPAVYGETADADGQARFKAQLGKKFEELLQENPASWIGEEESPYLQEKLDITYPSFPVETLIDRARKAYHVWRKVSPEQRAGILAESLDRMKSRFFEIAYATMHTTGQGFMMAFQASGPHAADRALEAIAAGYEELTRFPQKAFWDKPMGKFNIQLNKEWRAVPKGVSLVIGCSTFPTWNTVPGLYASLVTGNPVIVKPHPGAVLPIAIVVAEIQKVLKEQNLDPHICQLAPDTSDKLITKELAEHPDVKLIDFTGNSVFGNYLESLPGKTTFTEKTGVNCVLLHSVQDADKVAANLAFSVSLYSGQMCTAPQNFFIPEKGIQTAQGEISFEEFAQKFIDNLNSLIDNPKAGPFVLGTIQNKRTYDRIAEAEKLPGKVWLKSRTIAHPQFSKARTATPVVVEVNADKTDIFSKELFGPIALLIKVKDIEHALHLAGELARKHGAISCGAYTTDKGVREKIADEMALAGAPVSFNLVGGIYMNQNAGFSDFHVTGGNPAGNASFTNPEFVVKRFTWVGHREPAVA